MRQMLSLPVDVITHMKSQGDMSKYITKLVRQDKSESFEDRVKRIVNKMLQYSAPAPAINEDISSSIKGILNL
jgi:Trp operon repressor